MLKRSRKAAVRSTQSIRQVPATPDRKAVASDNDRQSPRRAEDIRSAQLWLGLGAPIADVMTMLEVRHRFDHSPSDCRAYAVEILWTAQGLSRPESDHIYNPKESPYAAA